MGSRAVMTDTDRFDLEFFPFFEFVRMKLEKYGNTLGAEWSKLMCIQVESKDVELMTPHHIFSENLERIKTEVVKAMLNVPFFKDPDFLKSIKLAVDERREEEGTDEILLSDEQYLEFRFLMCESLQKELFLPILEWFLGQKQHEFPKDAQQDNENLELDIMPCLIFANIAFEQMQQQLKVIQKWHEKQKVASHLSINFPWSDWSKITESDELFQSCQSVVSFVPSEKSGDAKNVILPRSIESFEFIPLFARNDAQASQAIMKKDLQVSSFTNLFELVMIWEQHVKRSGVMALFKNKFLMETLFRHQRELLQYCFEHLQQQIQKIKDQKESNSSPSYEDTVQWEEALSQALDQWIAALSLAYQGDGLSFDSDGTQEHEEGPLDSFVSAYMRLSKTARRQYKPYILIERQLLSVQAASQILDLCVVTSADGAVCLDELRLQWLNTELCKTYNANRNDSAQVKQQIENRIKEYHSRFDSNSQEYSRYEEQVDKFKQAFHSKSKLAPRKPQSILGIPVESLLRLDYRYQRWQFVESLISNYKTFTPQEFVAALGFVQYQINKLITPTAILCESTRHLLKLIDNFQQALGIQPIAADWGHVCDWLEPNIRQQLSMLNSEQAQNYRKTLPGEEPVPDLVVKKVDFVADSSVSYDAEINL